MVDIHLDVQGYPVPFLSIPLDDIQRLSIRHFKWLRFVVFSICGARGNLSATPHGPPVDYESTNLPDADVYYYEPLGDCVFVDYQGLNDKVTTSGRQTARTRNFRENVVERDRICVITNTLTDDCDAAHLIPRCKDSEYIQKVVQDRFPLYGLTPPPPIFDIDDVENGVLLDKRLHSKLGKGSVAFLKTPSSVSGVELDPTDIPRFDRGSDLTDHITLHQLKKLPTHDSNRLRSFADTGMLDSDTAFNCGAHVDALFQGTGTPRPPAIILDYLYGVATYELWKLGGEAHDVMKNYHKQYEDIPPLPRRLSSEDDYHPPSENDNKRKDPDYSPTSPKSRRHRSTRSGEEMARAMDELNSVLMYIQGITPEELANRREKQMEEEELKTQEASRSKVVEWMNTTDTVGL